MNDPRRAARRPGSRVFKAMCWRRKIPTLSLRSALPGCSKTEPSWLGFGDLGRAARFQAVLMVEPGDTNYQQIIDHVGGLKPGETKSIPPWPDQPPRQPDKPAESPPGA